MIKLKIKFSNVSVLTSFIFLKRLLDYFLLLKVCHVLFSCRLLWTQYFSIFLLLLRGHTKSINSTQCCLQNFVEAGQVADTPGLNILGSQARALQSRLPSLRLRSQYTDSKLQYLSAKVIFRINIVVELISFFYWLF